MTQSPLSKLSLILLLLVALFTTRTSSVYAQWKQVPGVSLGYVGSWAGSIVYKHSQVWAGSGTKLYMSPDSGKTWEWIHGFIGDHEPIVDIDVYDSNNILVTAQDDVFLSTDAGNNWRVLRTNEDFISGIFAGSKRNLVITTNGSKGGVFASSDMGNNWGFTSMPSWPAKVLMRPQGDLLLLDGDRDPDSAHAYFSVDSGFNWQQRPGKFAFNYYGLAVGGCKASNIYAANVGNIAPSLDYRTHIDISTDGGNSFQSVFLPQSQALAGSISIGNDALFCQTKSDRILRSTDGGITWQSIGGPSCASIKTRILTAINNNILIAGDDSGSVFVTRNCGGDSIPLGISEAQTPLVLNTVKETLVTGSCGIRDAVVTFGIDLCDTGSVILTAVSLSGSPHFKLQHVGSLPRAIRFWDSVTFANDNKVSTIDTAFLRLFYTVLGVPRDTTILLIGIGTTADLEFTPTLSLGDGHCAPFDFLVWLGVDSCDFGEVLLTKLTLHGANDFELADSTPLPRVVFQQDQVMLRYLNQSPSPDTAVLVVSYTAYGTPHDTTILLTGSGTSATHLVAVPSDTVIQTRLDSAITIPVTVYLPDSGYSRTLDPLNITYTLTYDTSYLMFIDSLWQSEVTARNGWAVHSATTLINGGLVIQIDNDIIDSLIGNCFLGTIKFTPRKATLAPTSVSLESFNIQLVSSGNGRYCLSPEKALVAEVTAEPAGVDPDSPEYQFEFYPDPVQSENRLQVVLPFVASGDVRIGLFDEIGIERYQGKFEGVSSWNRTLSVPVLGLPAGAYYLRVQQGEVVYTRKIQVVK